MKISKLFHWLYAFLMILPFIALLFNFVRFGLSSSLSLTSFSDVISLIQFPTFGGISTTIQYAYNYLVFFVFGMSGDIAIVVIKSLAYWTMLSITYLCFDVIMYVPLLVHRWLDKGVLE